MYCHLLSMYSTWEKKKMKEHCRSSPQGMCPELYLKENSFSP